MAASSGGGIFDLLSGGQGRQNTGLGDLPGVHSAPGGASAGDFANWAANLMNWLFSQSSGLTQEAYGIGEDVLRGGGQKFNQLMAPFASAIKAQGPQTRQGIEDTGRSTGINAQEQARSYENETGLIANAGQSIMQGLLPTFVGQGFNMPQQLIYQLLAGAGARNQEYGVHHPGSGGGLS